MKKTTLNIFSAPGKRLLRKSRVLLFSSCLLYGGTAEAQDVHFSQFYETAILRNPALTGIFSGDYKLVANYRNQWSSISKPFVTGQLSFETRIPISDEVNDFISCGILGNYDRAGSVEMKTLSVYPAISYNKSLEDQHHSFLSVGFVGGYMQRSFDASKITVNNQYQGGFNPGAGTGENISDTKISNWDLGAGVSFSSGGGAYNQVSYFLGVSGYHFTKPKRSFYNNDAVALDTRWGGNAGFTYRFNERTGLMMQADYMLQGKYNELVAGGLFNWKKATERDDDPDFVFYIGAFYRLNDAVIPVVKMDYMRFSFGFSYDVNVSKLKTASNLRGGYELSIVKTGLFKDPKWERSRTLCPHFFY